MSNIPFETGVNLVSSFGISLLITFLGVGLALLGQHGLRRIYEKKRNMDILENLKHELKINVEISNRIMERTSNNDIRPHIYSTNVWDSLISSGILFNCKSKKISAETISSLYNLYTCIVYGNFVENIISDIYLGNNTMEEAQLQYIYQKRKGHAEKIKKIIAETKLIDTSGNDTSTVL